MTKDRQRTLLYQNDRWNRRLGLMASGFTCPVVLLVLSPGFALVNTPAGIAFYTVLVGAAAVGMGTMTLRAYQRCAVWRGPAGFTIDGPVRTRHLDVDRVRAIQPAQVYVNRYCVRVHFDDGAAMHSLKMVALPYDDRDVLGLPGDSGTTSP